jgi:hypothetical protein
MTVFQAAKGSPSVTERDRIVIGSVCESIGGYLRIEKVYVEEDGKRVRDWPMDILSEAFSFVNRFKPRVPAKRKFIVRKKIPYVTENGGD